MIVSEVKTSPTEYFVLGNDAEACEAAVEAAGRPQYLDVCGWL